MVSTRSTWIPGVWLRFAPTEFSIFRSIVKMCWQTKKRSIVRPKSRGFPPQPIRITRAGPGLSRPIKSWTNKSLQSDGALWSPLGKLFQISFHKSGQEGGREEGGQAEEIRRWKANHSWLEQLAAVSDFQWRRDHLMTFWRQPLSYVIIYLFVLLHTDISSYSNIRIIRHILQKQIIASWWELSNKEG